MKKRYLLTLATLGLPLMLAAKPADGRVQKVMNPDGTFVEVALHGDEHFSFHTDATFSRVMEKNPKGFWVEAVRNGKAVTTSAADLQRLYEADYGPMETRASGPNRMAALDKEGRSTYNCQGEVPALCILLQYKDIEFSVADAQQAFHDMLNKEGYDKYGNKGSCRDYYIASSKGKFQPNFYVSRVVQLPFNNSYYVSDGSGSLRDGKYARFDEAINFAIKDLDDEIDFSTYDLDGDGKIDNIFFFYAGYGQADAPAGAPLTIWPHQATYYGEPLVVDGVKMATYACGNELQGSLPAGASQPYLDGIGTFCHEYGHVLGLPDMYEVTYAGGVETPGSYSIMDNGSYNENGNRPPIFTAYEKWVCNWLEYTDIEEGSTTTLMPLEDSNAAARIRVPRLNGTYYPNEYYLVENRGEGYYDQSIPGHGLLVWHIDYNNSAWTSNRVNSPSGERVKIIKPLSGGNSYTSDLTFPGKDNIYSYLSPDYYTDLKCNVQSPLFNCFITNIKYDKETSTGSFEYNKITEAPNVVATLHNSAIKDENYRTLEFSWDPVEGATDYLVSMYVYNSNGNRRYHVENTSTAGETKFNTGRLNSTFWKGECHFYVVAVVGVPSNAKSEELVLVPSEYVSGEPINTGVEELLGEDFVNVYAANGNIVAPEGARVFNLNGIETGCENLPKGIYIVRVADKAVKVMVK